MAQEAPAPAEIEARVRAASRALGRLLDSDPVAGDVISDLGRREPPPTDRQLLKQWQQRELLRIAARDLAGQDSLDETTAALSEMAADVLRVAVELAAAGDAMAVIGMGKLGAGELNYSSDIDVMVVGGDDRCARAVLDVARDSFRVDAALRPEGRDGPLTRSLESYEAYWERWALPWEFQALLKARAVAGDAELGQAFDASANQRLWSRRFGSAELRELRHLKARAEEQLERKGLSRREIKSGTGGIRDIEFSVQILQLVHGGDDPELRHRATLPSLEALAAGGYVGGQDAEALAGAYRFLRIVEHRLQLVDLQQVHQLPDQPQEAERLAKTMGYGGADLTGDFERDLARHRSAARAIHERLYFRPLLEAFAGTSALTTEAAAARLSAFGFADVERTRAAVTELSGGLSRTSRLMDRILPLLLGWLSESPDPDLGLLGLRGLVSVGHRSQQLTAAFRDSPEAARRLCLLLGTSPLMRSGFERQPQLVLELAHADPLSPIRQSALRERAGAGWHRDADERRSRLRTLRDEEVARLAARDILGSDDLEATEAGLTRLAEAVLDAALEALQPKVPMAVIGMGRLGGGELGYASDLDVLVVHGVDGAKAAAEAERAATELLRFVNGPTPSERIFELDSRLRPEGKQGPVSRSLEGFRNYWDRWAQPWERQALLRARPVAGDADLGEAFIAAARGFFDEPASPGEITELRRIKARVESERIPAGQDPAFHLKLGPGALADVEWTVQLLQLEGSDFEPNTPAALHALRDAGRIDEVDAEALSSAYRFCEQVRNRLFLVRGGPGDALPADPVLLAKLARSLDSTPTDLREEYRRLTRRSRAVVMRLFYGA
jgi:[glutamine synthetase] adenylyltransferase / [glutamine synthetase]-adenylyl-L-tyrosine phosphorylase